MERSIRVIIVDDHEMVRRGLSTYLSTEDDIDIVGEASNGKDAIALSIELQPDVILMDLVMEPMDGIEATREIINFHKNDSHEIKVIIVTSFIEEEKVLAALEAGAYSYLLKTASAPDISDAIRKAMRNQAVLTGEASYIMVNSLNRKSPKHRLLTQRELEVLQLLGDGKSNKEISEILFIGIKTVKTHVSNVLSKLELEDRTKAAVYANQHKLILK